MSWADLHRRLRAEHGLTLVELMVAALICAVGIMATLVVIDTSRDASVRAEKRESMSHHAQRELERLMELPWNQLAHVTAPTSSPWAGTPSGGQFAYDRKSPDVTEPLVVEATTGQVPGASDTWSDGQSRLSGHVHRYVTEIGENARRVTVVVTVTGANAPAPVLVSSIKTNRTL